ncbi:GDP-mannose 4,6-dehydratase [Patescibacteria group bacterium]|nr:GDP-mannose 4,6-dehydratase [Patescibacteria group bacterium]MBU1612959.1 GDP-mannose 4,6-dehydratase [Patescibacteria group bacterium]
MKNVFEKKNVLVTGGAGFIGSHLCERLLKEARVICIDNFSNSSSQNINHLLQYPDFEFINFDVNQPFKLEQFDELNKFKIKYQGVQEIYHLACPTSPKKFENSKIENLVSNSVGMINTLEIASQYKAKYIFTSTSVIYGDATGEKKVFKETDIGIIDHLSPRACYDEGKRFAETCVETYNQTRGIDGKIARVFTTYGTRMKLFENQLIPDFIINALEGKDLVIYGDENFATSLSYVTDIVDGLIRLMASDADVKVANLGGDSIVKYVDVANEIIKLTNSSSQVVFKPAMLFITKKGMPDLTYAKDKLGWLPLVRLEEGLDKMVDYVSANREALALQASE